MPMPRDEAFRWLRSRSGQAFSYADLEKAWGQNVSTLRYWLNEWEKKGRITRERNGNNGTIITVLDNPSSHTPLAPDEVCETDLTPPAEDKGVNFTPPEVHTPAPPKVRTPRGKGVKAHKPDFTPPESRQEDASTLPQCDTATEQKVQEPSLSEGEEGSVNSSSQTFAPLAVDTPEVRTPGASHPFTPLVPDASSHTPPTDRVHAPDRSVNLPIETPSHPLPAPSGPDPVADRLNTALEALSATAQPTRMPVAPPRGDTLAMVVGTARPEPRFRLHVTPPHREPRDWRIGPRLFAVAAAALGGLAAWDAWDITTWYGMQLSTDPIAQQTYAHVGQTFVLANILIPMICVQLAREGHLLVAWTARLFWASTVAVFCVLASIGFSARNLSDTTAVREAAAKQRQAIEARLGTTRQALASIPAARAVDVVEAEIQQAQPKVARSVWRSTKGCIDVTAPSSGEECAHLLDLRQEKARSEKRNSLMAEIKAAEVALIEVPKIADADPQVTMATRIFGRIPLIEGDTEDTKDLRVAVIVFGIEIMPALMFTIAALLWFRRRPKASKLAWLFSIIKAHRKST